MQDDLIHFLRSHKLFSSLDENSIQKIAPKFIEYSLARGEILFNQGDPSDFVYIVASGKLSAYIVNADHTVKVIGHIEAGEAVGELGALSNEPRSLTIKALRDSVLYKIASNDFVELCYTYSAIMFETIHPVIKRSQHIIQLLTMEKDNKHLTLAPINAEVDFNHFIEKFLVHAARYSSLIVLTDQQEDIKRLTKTALKEKISTIENSKKSTQKIIFIIHAFDSPLAQICLHRTDMLYLVADSQQEARIDQAILDFIHSTHTHLHTNPELILLHPEKTVLPQNTAHWLALTPFNLHHHIMINKTRHYQRLLRFIRGKAIGLVLGGGGTRGWAHLGAIKALREHRVPIDFIGGTSVGAIVAACYGLSESFDKAYEKFHQLVENSQGSVSLRSLTWPVISLFDAKKFTQAQMAIFQEEKIENLWVPYFCISSNMAKFIEDIHRSGLLWERTRASSSLPGILPPMVIDGELHLDGGLLNNLPVDVMKQCVGRHGKVIAVELNSAVHDYHKYQFPPVITFKDIVLHKLGITRTRYIFPRFIDTFLRGLMIGSSAKTKVNGLAATLLINLNLKKFRLLHSNLRQAKKILDVGYVETIARINQLKNKNI